jgi:hypothetical protein
MALNFLPGCSPGFGYSESFSFIALSCLQFYDLGT